MIEFRKKKQEEALFEQLETETNRNTELAGYGLLPKAPQQVVLNVPDSSKYKDPNNNSCIGYWEEKTGCELEDKLDYYCPACGEAMNKKNSTLDGAHVYKKGNPNAWFFVPLCSKCNNSENKEEMTVSTILVPVPEECYELKDNNPPLTKPKLFVPLPRRSYCQIPVRCRASAAGSEGAPWFRNSGIPFSAPSRCSGEE